MQYMASQRSRTPAQKAELRSYLDSHYPAPAKPATAAPTAKAPAPAKPAAPAKPKVIPPSTTVDEFNSRKPFPDADVSDLPSSALFSKKGPEHARESERNDYDMAARRYAFRGYERWNGALRGTRDTTEAGWADINRMRQITAETTTKDVTLHRALADLDFAGDGALIGKSFTDKGFMSTAYGGASRMTLEEAADYPIRLEIVAPAGTRGSLIGNTEEREFVLAPGTTLTIIDAVEAGGVKYVRAVVTSQGE